MTKEKKTPEQAARELLAAADQKRVDTALKSLNAHLESWQAENPDCALMNTGSFQGNQIDIKLNVVLKPKN